MRTSLVLTAVLLGVGLSAAAFLAGGDGLGDARAVAVRYPEAAVPPATERADPAAAQERGDSSEKTEAKVNQAKINDIKVSEKVSEKDKRVISRSAYDVTPLSKERVAELASKLDPEAYKITQQADTEAPFCGTLLDNHKEGVYCCVVCGLPLFSSANKFTSGTGWPSFYQPFDPQHVSKRVDRSHGMVRTEINCARCGAHLGHVFKDGPEPTGERYCLNSASLVFHEKGEELPAESQPIKTEVAYFAGGCFWGIEYYFQQGPGVVNVVSGFMQGHTDHPSYKQVCGHGTGHAETVMVTYDPTRISYHQLLEAFFKMHDPTELNRQGPDVGDQYRSGIWYVNDEQKKEAEEYVRMLENAHAFDKPIVTQIEKAKTFWRAEDYHQDYIETTGRACHVANPW